MKRLIVLCVAMAFGVTAIAQVAPKMEKQGTKTEQRMKDCYLMKDGKVWDVKDGKSTVLDKDITLKNGATLKPQGTLIAKNGDVTVLNEGDKIYADGQIEKSSSKKQMGAKEEYDNMKEK